MRLPSRLSNFLNSCLYRDDNYRQVSVSDGDDDDEEDSEPVYKRRSGRSLTIKGHPWSDESDNEGSSRPKLRSQLSEPSESESTRRSTRMYFL